MRVGKQLHLDVPALLDASLQVDGTVAERGGRFRSRPLDRAEQRIRIAHQTHPLAAATGDRLDEERIADLVARRPKLPRRRFVRQRSAASRHDRNAGARCRRPGRRLPPHQVDHVGWRSDERQSRIGHCAGERGVLRQEAVPGMDCVGSGPLRGVNDLRDAKVALTGRVCLEPHRLVGVPHVRRQPVAVGIDRHRWQPHLVAGRMIRTAISPRLATSTFTGTPTRAQTSRITRRRAHLLGSVALGPLVRPFPATAGYCRASSTACGPASPRGWPAR